MAASKAAVTAPVFTEKQYRDWRNHRVRDEMPALIQATGIAPIRFLFGLFYWTCPGCGGTASGLLADEPVPGWEAPRWVRSGDDEHLTLTPSLGCPRWREGTCIGHWWLRDGRLVLA